MPRYTNTSILVVLFIIAKASGYFSRGNLERKDSPQPSSSLQHLKRQDPACGFIGNPDIYGLGIRLGIYLQWIASCISNSYYVSPIKHPGLLDSYLIFNSALLVAVFVLTARPLDTHIAEIFIIFFLVFNGWSTAFPIHIRDHEISIRNEFWEVGARSALTFTLNLIWAVYAFWFWIAGVNATFRETPCGTKVFIFAKVDMTPGTGGFLAAKVIFGAASLFMTLAMSITVLGGLATQPRIFFSPITKSVIWNLFLPARMRRRRDTESQQQPSRPEAASTHPPGWLQQRVDFVRAQRKGALENQNANSSLQKAWKCFTGRGPGGTTETPKSFSIRQKRYGRIALFGTIVSILAIEFTLSWNNIKNVYSMSSTGQLIAFVVGLGPLIITVYGVLKETAEASPPPIAIVSELESQSAHLSHSPGLVQPITTIQPICSAVGTDVTVFNSEIESTSP